MTNSRLEQENYYRQMVTQNQNSYQQPEYNQPMRQQHIRQNDENFNPYL